ncbi:MAG: MFS transporter [Marinobacterium sp.]|nr:MFS transporter [Marinobacterium sp.]
MIEQNSASYWRATLALCIGSIIVFANVYITQPLLPMLADELSLSALESSLTLTLATLTLGLSLLFYGPLSDSLGRRWIMLLTMAGAVGCTALLSQVESYSQLLLLRALQGVLLGGLPAIAIAWMGDEFSAKAMTSAVGIYIAGNTLGGLGGRLVGGFVGEYQGWNSAFEVMFLISVVGLALFALLLPRSRGFSAQPLDPGRMSRAMLNHLRNPLLLAAYLIGGFNLFIFVNQYSYITFVLAAPPWNLPASMLGLLFLTYLSGTIGSACCGQLASRFSLPQLMSGGIVLLMLGTVLTLLPWLETIIAGFLINAFGFFVTHSSASSWVGQHAESDRASASSLYLVFYYLGSSTGGFYLAPFWQASGWSGVVVGSLLVLSLTFAVSLWLWKGQASQRLAI